LSGKRIARELGIELGLAALLCRLLGWPIYRRNDTTPEILGLRFGTLHSDPGPNW